MMAFGESIRIKTRREIEAMRVAGRHVAEILLELRELAKPGVTTGELDEHARRSIRKRGVESSFLGYGPHGLPPYPAVLCVSVNDEVVHGIPGRRELKEGDVLSLDFGVAWEGYHGDSAVTVPIGALGPEAERLVEATRRSLEEGIGKMAPGNRLSDIGHAVQARAEGEGFSVVRQFVGHGIGREMHEPPQVLHFGKRGTGLTLREGMVFTIEPMLNQGVRSVLTRDDGWTVVTADSKLSAQFEHTVAVTREGVRVLTLRPDEVARAL